MTCYKWVVYVTYYMYMNHIIWSYKGPYIMVHIISFLIQFQVCDEVAGNNLDFGVSIFGQSHVMQGKNQTLIWFSKSRGTYDLVILFVWNLWLTLCFMLLIISRVVGIFESEEIDPYWNLDLGQWKPICFSGKIFWVGFDRIERYFQLQEFF